MRSILPAIALLPVLALGACDTSSLPTATQVQQVEVAIQNAAQAACKAAPTVESIGIIAAALIAGGTPVDQIANQVVNQFCSLVNNPPATASRRSVPTGASGYVGNLNGYPIYKK
jgi:hypothetical protein